MRFGSRATAGKDLRAGLVLGVVNVPDGLAQGVLAGVNPVYGLYAYMVGGLTGALATSSVFMAVNATGAMAVIVSDVPQVHEGPDADAALFTLTVLTGLVMLTVGLLRLGSMVRFVPNAVLAGFVNGVAVNIVLGQVENFTGYASDSGNRVTRAVDTVLHPGLLDWPTVAVGAATILLILLLERTPLRSLGMVVAVVLSSASVAVLSLDSVRVLDDIAEVPGSLPSPTLPSLSLVAGLVLPAVSLAFVGLVQGAGISGSVPNPDGRYPDASGDFRGQGVANVASGLFSGLPVGGSMSATALVRSAGARSKLALLTAGLVTAGVVLAFGGLIGLIAMPALGGLLILVGIRTFKVEQVALVWRTGRVPRVVMVTTFALTLLVPLQYAVLSGIALAVVLLVFKQSNKIALKRWRFPEDSALPVEEEPPAEVAEGDVVVLVPYGSLFFAAAANFEAQLPEVTPASRGSVVIVRLRGKQDLGSTFIRVLTRYADSLAASGSRLMLSGISDEVQRQLTETGALDSLGADSVFPATDHPGEALQQAMAQAQAWVASRQPGGP